MLVTKKHSKVIKIAACLLIMSAAIFLLGNFVFAATGPNLGLNYAADTGLNGGQDVRIIIANIVRIALGFLGIIAVCLIIYAGWLWMTSAGNPEKIEQAKSILKNAVIGLIIILSSFAIASFILNNLIAATGGDGLNGSGGGDSGGSGLGAMGGEIVDYTFPANNQQNVPRNLMRASAVLNEPVNPKTFDNTTAEVQVYTVNPTSVDKEDRIYKSPLAASFFGRWLEKLPLVKKLVKNFSVDKALAAGASDPENSLAPVAGVTFTTAPDGKTLIFNLPYEHGGEYLGSPTAAVWYSVTLKGGKTGILKADGNSLFGDKAGETGYRWKFAVGTVIDNTPPKIVSVIPLPDATEDRNVVVQINFSEAIDPTSASGKLEIAPNKCDDAPACTSGEALKPGGFNNIIVQDITNGAVNNFIAGNLYISNQYRTVEFLTDVACGINSCGQTIFCLPADKRIKVSLKAATLAEPPSATALWTDAGYNGVVDMAGNSLDGNGDGKAQGPEAQSKLLPYNANSPDQAKQGDDYFWAFQTNKKINLIPPKVIGITPALNSDPAGTEVVPQAIFDKLLYSRSLTKSSVALKSDDPEYYYWIYSENNLSAENTTVYIGHNRFNNETKYSVQFNAGVRDNYQNCFMPCSGLGVVGKSSCCEGGSCNGTACDGTAIEKGNCQ